MDSLNELARTIMRMMTVDDQYRPKWRAATAMQAKPVQQQPEPYGSFCRHAKYCWHRFIGTLHKNIDICLFVFINLIYTWLGKPNIEILPRVLATEPRSRLVVSACLNQKVISKNISNQGTGVVSQIYFPSPSRVRLVGRHRRLEALSGVNVLRWDHVVHKG